MDLYYLNKATIQNNIHWNNEVLKAKLYHGTYVNEMFAF